MWWQPCCFCNRRQPWRNVVAINARVVKRNPTIPPISRNNPGVQITVTKTTVKTVARASAKKLAVSVNKLGVSAKIVCARRKARA